MRVVQDGQGLIGQDSRTAAGFQPILELVGERGNGVVLERSLRVVHAGRAERRLRQTECAFVPEIGEVQARHALTRNRKSSGTAAA